MEVKLSKSGHKILSIRGKNLCSIVDPIKEAQRWVQKSITHVKRNDFIILIGLGAGYHIPEIIKKHDIEKLIVIEKNKRCINFFKENWPSLFLNLKMVNYNSEIDFLKIPEILDVIRRNFYILSLPVVNDLFCDFVYETKKALLGRSKQSFKIQSENILGHLQIKLNEYNDTDNISWKIFDQSDALVGCKIKDQFLIRALRELII